MKKLIATILVGFQLIAAPVLVVAQSTTTQPAVLYFNPAGETAATGNVTLDSAGNFTVEVKVNTHNTNSAGADVIVTYSTAELQYVSGTNGTFYPVPILGAPTSNTTGKIQMAYVIQAQAGSNPVYSNGTGTVATLKFKPKAASPIGTKANLGFEFALGSTTDSNVAGTAAANPDILGAVRSVELTIQAGTPGSVLDSVTLTPATATIAPNATRTFTATAKDEDGNTLSSGITYSWDLTGDGDLSGTTGSSVTYTAGSSAGSADIAVTATQGSVDVTDSSAITISGGVIPDGGPAIDYIVPGEGDGDADVEVDIYGSNFGSDEGRVYVGARLADIVSWSDGKIVVLVPQVNVSRDTEYQVKVRRLDDEEDTYRGYTYLDKTGLPMLPWLIMFPLNGPAAMFAKKRWFKKK